MSIGQVNLRPATGEIAFETREFYLACFLRCTGYELIDLRAEGRRKVFMFRDRPTRREDVMAFYRRQATAAVSASKPRLRRPGEGGIRDRVSGGGGLSGPGHRAGQGELGSRGRTGS